MKKKLQQCTLKAQRTINLKKQPDMVNLSYLKGSFYFNMVPIINTPSNYHLYFTFNTTCSTRDVNYKSYLFL